MRERIESMGLTIDMENMIDGSYRVFGESDKLKELREILNANDYADDTEIASRVFGIEPPTDTLSCIMVCDFENDKGYMAVA